MGHASLPRLIEASLKANAVVTNRVDDRIHYQTIPQKSKYPHIYYARTGLDREEFLEGDDGYTEEHFVIEIVAQSFDEELLDAVQSALYFDGGMWEGVEIFVSELRDASDDYQFRSADSDALFMHAFQLTIYL